MATTVTPRRVAWPLLRKAGYPQENGGAVLAAAGIGAILSPPTLGAAAFIIAELLNVSYLQVLIWATIPTLLYYLGIILAVEMDARRFQHPRDRLDVRPAAHCCCASATTSARWWRSSCSWRWASRPSARSSTPPRWRSC